MFNIVLYSTIECFVTLSKRANLKLRLTLLSEVSTAIVDGENIDCGHYIPEEAPDILVKNIKEFFV